MPQALNLFFAKCKILILFFCKIKLLQKNKIFQSIKVKICHKNKESLKRHCFFLVVFLQIKKHTRIPGTKLFSRRATPQVFLLSICFTIKFDMDWSGSILTRAPRKKKSFITCSNYGVEGIIFASQNMLTASWKNFLLHL